MCNASRRTPLQELSGRRWDVEEDAEEDVIQQGWCASWSLEIENEDTCAYAVDKLLEFECHSFYIRLVFETFQRSPLMEPFSFLSFATRGWLNGWVVSFFFTSMVMWWYHLLRIHQLSRMGKLSDGHGCLWVCFPCVVVNVHPDFVSLPACNSDDKTPHWFKLMQFAHVE